MTSWGGPRASRSLLAAVAAAALAGPASSAPCALPRTTGCSTCTADPNCFYALSYGSAGACVNLTSITAADYVISLSSPCARVPTCAAHSTCTTCASDANCMTCGQTSSTALCVPYASSSSNAADELVARRQSAASNPNLIGNLQRAVGGNWPSDNTALGKSGRR